MGDAILKPRLAFRRSGRWLVVAAFALLASCGFKPLYGENELSPDVVEDLASIYVEPIPDRIGQLVHNELSNRMTPLGAPADAKYTLKVKLEEVRDDVAIRQDESITRVNYRLTAIFELTSLADDTVLLVGNAWSMTAFDRVQSDFATIVAQEDAQERLAKDVAEEVRTRIAVHFGR